MWIYEKKLEYPTNVSGTDPRMAKLIIEQYGGPDGELTASLRYLTQRYTMPLDTVKGLLTDIGTEELAHLEIVATLVYKLTDNASLEEIKEAGFDEYYVNRDKSLFYVDAVGNPWTAAYIQSKGDPITDLHEDMAAEQKARTTYEYLIKMSDDPCVKDVLRFLREREVVHFQRFGEALRLTQEWQDTKKVY